MLFHMKVLQLELYEALTINFISSVSVKVHPRW